MKVKLIFVVAILTVLTAVISLSFRSKDYTPRSSSQIEELYSYQVPGGRFAAGMSDYFGALRNNISTGTVSVTEYMSAIEASLKLVSKRTVDTTKWEELGPDNVGGRIRAFLQDKDTPTVMYAGSVSGGLFKSTTRGSNWFPVNDYQENLNVSCIAQNSDGIIAYGTGEGSFVSIDGTPNGTPGFAGAGIFVSTNRGRTFTRVNATAAYGNINSMSAEKGGQRIYAATNTGIKYSDNGTSWTSSRNGNSLEVKVAVNGKVYAQSGNAIVRSTDRGASWTVITPPNADITRASIAVSPQDPNYVYVMASASSRLSGVYRSTDGGDNWTQIIAKGTTYFDPLVSGLTNPQGSYNNVISVDPSDKDHIIMGGAYLADWKSGANPKYIASLNDFGGANPAYVHADKHVLEWDITTTPPTLICGNDGGLFFSSDNLKTFTPKNFGFNATQFYAVAADYEGNVTGGSQDNGTQYINRKGNTKMSAVEIKGGDGFQAEISVKNSSIVFAETYYGNLSRSRDYGKTQSCIWDRRISKIFTGLTDTAKYCDFSLPSSWAPFNTKIRLWEHPLYDSSQSRLFLARYGQIWMGVNVTNFQKEPEWYLIAGSHGNAQVWDLEPTLDGNSLFFSNSSTVYRIDGLNTATYDKWSSPTAIPPGITITNLGFSSGGRAITSVNLDPNDNNTALITLGNYGNTTYVYKGTNMLGTPTFTNITGNLPPMPVYDGFISLKSSNLLFIGTDLGVYVSDNGGTTWTAQTNPKNKFPKVATMALRQYIFPGRSRGQIYAGTHGRGFFKCQDYFTSINTVRTANRAAVINAYPNPSNNTVNLKFTVKQSEDVTINIYDLTGKIIYTKVFSDVTPGEQNITLETAEIPSGTYVLSAKGLTTNAMVRLIVRH